MRYLREAIAEVQQARVPQQLLEPSDDADEGEETEAEAVQEFSGTAAVAGYTAPLGSKRQRRD